MFLPYSIRRFLACSEERPRFGEVESLVNASLTLIVCQSKSDKSIPGQYLCAVWDMGETNPLRPISLPSGAPSGLVLIH